MKDKIIGQFTVKREISYDLPSWLLFHNPTQLYLPVAQFTFRKRKQAYALADEIQERGCTFDSLADMEKVRPQLVAIMQSHRPKP